MKQQDCSNNIQKDHANMDKRYLAKKMNEDNKTEFKRNRIPKNHIYIVVLSVLTIVTVLEAVLSLLFYKANTQLADQVTKLEEENNQLRKTLDDLQYEKKVQELLDKMDTLKAGTILDANEIDSYEDRFFYTNEIEKGDAVYERINGKSYKKNSNIGLEDLRYLKVLHYNFDHEIQVGELIVNKAVSEDVLNIFRELFAIEYEIQSMYLIDNYWMGNGGDSDTASIDANNTSAFCYRKVTGGGRLSNHAYGCAIDINPQQNPYVYRSGGKWKWYHENADDYIDRTTGDPHMIVKGDACYEIFTKYGFLWGGEWENPIDYQHFEKDIE